MSQIFISYSRQDRQFVDGLIRQIEEVGYSVWMDRADIRGGSQWRAAITQAIRDCTVFLVVLSSNSQDSKNVGRELELAADHVRPIIPIIYDSCEIPAEMEYHFAGVQRIDFSDSDTSDTAFDQLVDALKSVATAAPAARNPPAPRRPPKIQPAPPQDQPAPSLSAPPPTGPVLLAQLLPGRWNVQISHPMIGVAANLTLDLAPNGMFQGQLLKPIGVTVIQGQWQVTPMNQIVLQGQETNGFQVGPYGTVIQVNQILPNRLMGISSAGEQVLLQKIA